MTAAPPTATRPRRVFGRLRNVALGERTYTLELTHAGLVVRPKYGRHPRTLDLRTLADLADGQLPLPL
jgi:hypothetical protein